MYVSNAIVEIEREVKKMHGKCKCACCACVCVLVNVYQLNWSTVREVWQLCSKCMCVCVNLCLSWKSNALTNVRNAATWQQMLPL